MLISCGNDNINNRNKRNDKWAWWVDVKNENGKWIPLAEKATWQNGRYTKFYSDGTTYETGRIKNGLPTDTTFRYGINGKLSAYDIIKSDTIISYFLDDGLNKIYRQNFTLEGENFIQNHAWSGREIGYFKNGQKRYEENFSDNIGWVVTYFDNGQKKDSAYFFEKGKGFILKEWYDNGKLKMTVNANNGIQQEPHLEFYDNGQIKDSVYFFNGLQEGIGKHWRYNGKIQYQGEAKNGKVNGKVVEYYENGTIKVEGIFSNGINISNKRYDETGKLIFK